jgi:hypothetical protein
LQLNARLKPELFAAVFAKFGRIHIPAILEKASAQALYAAMTSGDVPWQMHYNDGPASYDIPAVQVDALTELEQLALRKPIWSRAQSAFQYCFDNFSLADHHARGEYLGLGLMQAYDLMRSPAMLEFARRVTGVREISSVDAQATRYRRGDFLTSHDDRDEDKGRVAAYVLNMTPQWRSDWGGLLQFLDEDGHVAEAYAPAFNALNILRVPQSHSVSIVAPFAGQPRLSITGWFRR